MELTFGENQTSRRRAESQYQLPSFTEGRGWSTSILSVLECLISKRECVSAVAQRSIFDLFTLWWQIPRWSGQLAVGLGHREMLAGDGSRQAGAAGRLLGPLPPEVHPPEG